MADDAEQHVTLLADISQQLGVLQGQNNLILQEQGRATEGRKLIYDRLDKVEDRLMKVEGGMQAVADMKPAVDDYKNLRANVTGGVIVLGAIGAALFTGVGFVLKDIVAIFIAHVQFK